MKIDPFCQEFDMLNNVMKKMIITKIHIRSAANFLGLMGVATGTIKGVVLPVLALVGAGA